MRARTMFESDGEKKIYSEREGYIYKPGRMHSGLMKVSPGPRTIIISDSWVGEF